MRLVGLMALFLAGCGVTPEAQRSVAPVVAPDRPLVALSQAQRRAARNTLEDRALNRCLFGAFEAADPQAIRCWQRAYKDMLTKRREEAAFAEEVGRALEQLGEDNPVNFGTVPRPDIAAETAQLSSLYTAALRDVRERCSEPDQAIAIDCRGSDRVLNKTVFQIFGRSLTKTERKTVETQGRARAWTSLQQTAEACGYTDWEALAGDGGRKCYPT